MFLDHMCLDVGVCYVDKPVTRTLTLTNISNLTSAFKVQSTHIAPHRARAVLSVEARAWGGRPRADALCVVWIVC